MENSVDNVKEGLQVERIMVTSKTKPPFKIWLFPPQDDIISKKIEQSGKYEPEETAFIEYVASTMHGSGGWAVDIGANIGFHSLHMAALGMKVVGFEPSPDTASLLEQSIKENGFDGTRGGSIQIIQAAAAESSGLGRLVRHHDSPGMTILQRNGDSSSLPFGVEDIIADDIPLVRPEASLANIITKDGTPLQLLKVDAEGYELHAFRGVNLDRFPFRFVTFEFFPELLWKAGQTDPLDLLNYINSFGYVCAMHPKSLKDEENLLCTPDEFQAWYEGTIVPAYENSSKFHLNIYCLKRDKVR